jgi:hypothetical protein
MNQYGTRFPLSQFRMQPARIKINAIRPSEGADVAPSLGEQIGVVQRSADALMVRCLDRRAIDDSAAPVPEAHGQPAIRQGAHCQNAPRRRFPPERLDGDPENWLMVGMASLLECGSPLCQRSIHERRLPGQRDQWGGTGDRPRFSRPAPNVQNRTMVTHLLRSTQNSG